MLRIYVPPSMYMYILTNMDINQAGPLAPGSHLMFYLYDVWNKIDKQIILFGRKIIKMFISSQRMGSKLRTRHWPLWVQSWTGMKEPPTWSLPATAKRRGPAGRWGMSTPGSESCSEMLTPFYLIMLVYVSEILEVMYYLVLQILLEEINCLI